jgi:hypothetical protein
MELDVSELKKKKPMNVLRLSSQIMIFNHFSHAVVIE